MISFKALARRVVRQAYGIVVIEGLMTVNNALAILNEPVFGRVRPENRKLMLAGLYFSLFGARGLELLHCRSQREAYQNLANAVGGKPLTLRGYRDEFDSVCSQDRVGFPKKVLRATHLRLMRAFRDLSLADYTTIIKGVFGILG